MTGNVVGLRDYEPKPRAPAERNGPAEVVILPVVRVEREPVSIQPDSPSKEA